MAADTLNLADEICAVFGINRSQLIEGLQSSDPMMAMDLFNIIHTTMQNNAQSEYYNMWKHQPDTMKLTIYSDPGVRRMEVDGSFSSTPLKIQGFRKFEGGGGEGGKTNGDHHHSCFNCSWFFLEIQTQARFYLKIKEGEPGAFFIVPPEDHNGERLFFRLGEGGDVIFQDRENDKVLQGIIKFVKSS